MIAEIIDSLTNWWRRLPTWAVLALPLVVVFLVIAIGAASCGSSSDNSAASSSDSGDTTEVALDQPPTNLACRAFQGVPTPQADQGPHDRVEPAPLGYDRSPPGAALAAINATVRMSVATDSQWTQVSSRLIAPGDGRDWFIANRLKVSTLDAVPAGQAPTILGYRVTSFTPNTADVDFYARQPDQSVTVNHTTVAWTAGQQWALVLPTPDSSVGPRVEAADAPPADLVATACTQS